ncbi:SET domain-containing protein [Mollisia scopiformis]|uniref:SET domain-containing protein n=1 Tax=Mollisia scopiformis TaxID=149040 RepID=A0A194XIZ1_MOLSC|nr:SET domain-containing protein [Mollisia scopiformis]KUJ20210.1 SET domain-containing protein [Mollisia scopiformis]
MEVDDFETATAAFLAWLSRLGIQISPKIAIADLRSSGKNRGAVAVADIEEDEILFTIPRSSVFNTNTALNDSQLSFLRDAVAEMPSWLALTSAMLVEAARKESKWAPYFAILPQHLDSLVFWKDTELSELQASMVAKKIGKATAEEMFKHHIAPLGIENASPTMCHKVASVIMAYAFDIPEIADKEDNEDQDEDAEELVSDDGNGEKTILSIVPLADILNADADRNNARLCCDNEDLEMRAIRHISDGDEIFNDYGQLPRSDLLRRYGYLTDNYAVYDVAELSTHAILSQFRAREALHFPGHQALEPLPLPDLNKRIELAQREAIYEDAYDLSHPDSDGPSIPDELLALLYILLLDNENLAAIKASEIALPSRSKLSTGLVGQVLIKLLELREREYATTLEEDELILQSKNLPHRKAMAVQVRHGEKQVLRKAIQEAATFTASDKRMRGQKRENEVVASGTKRRQHQTDGDNKKARKR